MCDSPSEVTIPLSRLITLSVAVLKSVPKYATKMEVRMILLLLGVFLNCGGVLSYLNYDYFMDWRTGRIKDLCSKEYMLILAHNFTCKHNSASVQYCSRSWREDVAQVGHYDP